MSKKYSIKPKISDNLVEQLLHNRGIKNKEDKEKFLNPNFEKHLHNPFLLPDIRKAVRRILKAIEKNERIGIWSDYDADGIPGGALLHDFFEKIGFKNFTNYIPCRHEEGYGLNNQGIEELSKNKVKLLITVDCGTRDNECVEQAKKLNMEIIITDHHEPSEKLPKAFAIINPKLKTSKYPEKILCGTGVVWKLIEALRLTILSQGKLKFKDGQHKWLLDLVGLATISDMVPLVGENRVLVSYGLLVLRKTKRPGLIKLFKNLRINQQNLNEDDIAFMITPRINAASRMGHPIDAFNLLVAKTEAEAENYAKHLENINKERKILVANIVKEAKKKAKEKLADSEKPVIVLGNPDWRPAVLGLVANSLVEEFDRPVFLWGRSASAKTAADKENGEILKGSCRSDGKTDVVALMEKTKDHFLEYGGHKMSGAFSVDFEKIHDLENALIEASTALPKKPEEILVDAELELKKILPEKVEEILKLAPFGIENEKPLFIFPNVIPEKINRFGRASEHLSINFRDGTHSLRAIAFFTSPDQFGELLQEGLKTNLVANVEKSFWNGSSEIRLRIIDFF
ncbi:MAG: single-stranded-DNA-specific exonuclease RecJ [Candidatus Zambryskibacteria bacterium]|nr:single-stranded-DNA-specific exonuclease RecJ [Candidatus Zambryskibacteria bacterium]